MQRSNHQLEAQLRQVEKRAQLYWYEDGLSEMAAGTILLLLGLLFLADGLTPDGSLPNGISAIGLPILMFGGFFIARWIVRRLKTKIVYPRTGYARYRTQRVERRPRWQVGLVAGVVAAVVSQLLLRVPATHIWIPTATGVLFALFLLIFAYQLGLARYYVLAGVSALLGLAASLSAPNDTVASGLYFGGMGVTLLITGGAVLARYLRRTQPPTEAA